MTAKKDLVGVTCFRCQTSFQIDRDELRGIVDAGDRPWCGCVPPAPPRPATRAGQKAETRGQKPATAAGVILSVMTPGTAYRLSVLIVCAWKSDRVKFGLAGYPDYPDSNRVYTEIVKMARPGGPLEKTAPRTYRRKVVDAKAGKD